LTQTEDMVLFLTLLTPLTIRSSLTVGVYVVLALNVNSS